MFWTITGPSASGKTTLARNILAAHPEAKPLTSTTTRAPRPTDMPGEYEYVSNEEFDRLSRQGAFLWEVAPHGNRYGTRKSAVDAAFLESLYVPILVIEAVVKLHSYAAARGQGAQVRSLYIHIEDEAELRKRITGRGDSPEEIERRLHECLDWNERSLASGVPFYMLDGSKTPEEMSREALAFFSST